MSGHLAENIAYFARALRAAGLPVGPKAVIEAIEAVEASKVGNRDDFYWTLHAVLVKRHEHSLLFDQAFRIFWRRRAMIEKLMQQYVHAAPAKQGEDAEKANRRIADALMKSNIDDAPPPPPPEIEIDARMTLSDEEVLRSRDFEQMSAVEIDEARRQIAKLVLPLDLVPTRRLVAERRGTIIDPRRSMRASMRAGGAAIALRFQKPAERHPPIVALCDISGSMSQYSRIFLHFLHALSRHGRKVSSFLFATELSNITRSLQGTRDPDLALAQCGRLVRDWDGGTRIAGALHRFNMTWSRRVLGQGAIVLLITDGLERDLDGALEREMDRLHRSCRRLIWLNPLLRFDGFEAKAGGIRAMLPHVDEFRTLHNLNALADLCRALQADSRDRADPKRYLTAA
jgi:uncharacterized protein with von Willebrand factor type A (vWA) domain